MKESRIMEDEARECVLVTGGTGLVGKAIERLVNVEDVTTNHVNNRKLNFVFVSSKDADLTDKEQARLLFTKYKPDYVINLAARVGGLYANMNDNESFFGTNVSINENVLYWSSQFGTKKCISCLSTCIFPDSIDYPLDESKIHLGPPHRSNWGYSMAKRQVDLLNKRYNERSGGQQLFTAVIPTNVYGVHDNFSLELSHVVPALIHKSYLKAIEASFKESRSASLEICGSGKAVRQFIEASDLARLILWTLENYNDTEPLILSPDETDEISIAHVAEIICERMGAIHDIEMIVEYDTNLSDGQLKKTASNRKLRQLYPEFQFTPFEVGVIQVIDWFCHNYSSVRK